MPGNAPRPHGDAGGVESVDRQAAQSALRSRGRRSAHPWTGLPFTRGAAGGVRGLTIGQIAHCLPAWDYGEGMTERRFEAVDYFIGRSLVPDPVVGWRRNSRARFEHR